ncbi:TonB-dependent siderophore receptor [Pelagicoccus albus]|uniref:TonB-dependent receptor n=1 Tax=Pelagicoccus albus TaxID=415222 RepID=A0A7X1EA55_9BACT|nr:TonB-dependent receptor [Pelagicoccus albus]MBC2607908.1 TonB-dependent receptor [Pelagicoccus albus]
MNDPLYKYLCISSVFLAAGALHAQDSEVEELEEVSFEEEVSDPLGILPTRPVDSVFGYAKSQLEIPRSVDIVEGDILESYGIDSVGRIAAVASGAYTNNQFGIEGNVDVRNVEAENYFRGFKKLKNRGNFRTPIGAADRFELIKGIPPVQYGAGSVGGILNYFPRTARGDNTKYQTDATGKYTVTVGTYDKFQVTAETGIPYKLGDKAGGAYFYLEYEDSGSFYDYLGNEDTIFQANIVQDLTDTITLETGFMYADLSQIQNPGWNRVTQDLIDNKTYITGDLSITNLDRDGSGRLEPDEVDAGNGFAQFTNRIPGLSADADGNLTVGGLLLDDWVAANTIDSETGLSIATLDITGTTQLSNSVGFTEPEDYGYGENLTAFFDLKGNPGGNLTWKYQFFYDAYETARNTTYGFNNDYDSAVWENKLTFVYDMDEKENFDATFVFGGTFRHLDTYMLADFLTEPFNYRDLSQPVTANTRIAIATIPGGDKTAIPDYFDRSVNIYDNIIDTVYDDLGAFVTGDFTFADSILLNVGASIHEIDIESTNYGFLNRVNVLAGTPGAEASDSYSAVNASLSYRTGMGLIPYFTFAKSTFINDGQASEVDVGTISAGSYLQDSDLMELGVKGSFLDDSLTISVAAYEQNRTEYNSQLAANIDENTKGVEFSARWAASDNLFATFALNTSKTTRPSATSLLGTGIPLIADRMGITIEEAFAAYGGLRFNSFGGPLVEEFSGSGAEEPGRPDHNYSLYVSYLSDYGLSITTGLEYTAEVEAGWTGYITLPEYYLVNMSVGYEFTDNFSVRLNVDNLFDNLDWYKSQNLFFDTLVLAGSGREAALTATYKF